MVDRWVEQDYKKQVTQTESLKKPVQDIFSDEYIGRKHGNLRPPSVDTGGNKRARS